jgi:hypothetical protein
MYLGEYLKDKMAISNTNNAIMDRNALLIYTIIFFMDRSLIKQPGSCSSLPE